MSMIIDALCETAIGQGCKILKSKLFPDGAQPNQGKAELELVEENISYVSGVIVDEIYGFYLVEVNGEEHQEPVDDLQFKFYKGDKVRLEVVDKDEEHFGNSMELSIKTQTMVPANIRTHVGIVTLKNFDFTVIDDRFILINSLHEEDVELMPELHQEYKFKAIESSQFANGSTFEWRIVKILNKLAAPTAEEVAENIFMNDVTVQVRQHPTTLSLAYVKIDNKSNNIVKLINFQMTESDSHLIKLDFDNRNSKFVDIHPKKFHKVAVKIFPRRDGNGEATFTADFETFTKDVFQKKCRMSVEIYSTDNISPPQQSTSTGPRFEAIKFENYKVPETLTTIDLKNREMASIELLNTFDFLNENLKRENYLHKMHFGVYFEELAIALSFASYAIKKTSFEAIGNCLRLKVNGVSEKRPSIMIGDTILVTSLNDVRGQAYIGRIEKVENDSILLKFHNYFHENHHNQFYKIDFNFSRKIFRQFHHALDTVVSNGLGYDFLFPEGPKQLKHPHIPVNVESGNLLFLNNELEWFDKKLNHYQKEAVVNALRAECRPYPYIIYGPPGTGKTMTVVELIKQLYYLDSSSRLIVAAPSNSAANLFTQALNNFGRFKSPYDFVRFVSHNQVEKDLIPPAIRQFCAKIDTSSVIVKGSHYDTTEQEEIKTCKKEDIKKYRICISTLNCLGAMMKIDFKNHFTHVIIDEVGQSIEPETLIPLTLLKKETGVVILSGDPKQLGPMLVSPRNLHLLKQLALERSFLERLLMSNEFYSETYGPNGNEFDPNFVTKLKKNYRSIPSVLKVYNDFFYNNELEGAISDENSSEADLLSIIHDQELLWNTQTSNKKCGVYFVDVIKGINGRVKDSCSWHNKIEIHALFSFLNELSKHGIKLADIGVITPYALQVKMLKLRLAMLTDTDLKIGTVEEFQGQERHIIIVSTVRTDENHFKSDRNFGLGFLSCPKRMNVVISRARTLLVVFGNGKLLMKDENWEKFIQYTKDNKTYVTDDRA